MKHIAIFHPSSELYGADRIMVLAAKLLTDFIPVIYLPSEGVLKAYILQEIPNAIVVINPKMPVIARAMFSPKGLITVLQNSAKFNKTLVLENNKYQFDLFYVNTLACSLLLPLLKKFNVKIITHVHEILERPRIAAYITAKLAFTYSHTVISVSKAVKDNLHRITKNKKAKSIVVHNGIDAIQTVSKNIESKKISFYLFGRIKPEKGQWYLIEALSKIPKDMLNKATFTLVGGTLKGKEYLLNDLKEQIAKHNLENFITLKGFTNNITQEISNADVCLVPSLMKDPFPTTVLEAMSASKVVIASNTGGAKEAITDQEDGFIIPANDATYFSNSIVKLIKTPELIPILSQRAKITFDKKFTTQVFKEKWKKTILS